MKGKGGPENIEGVLAYDEVARPIYGPVTRINLPNYCPNASLTASSCDSTVACSQSESNEVHIDEFLGVMGEYECSQAQGLKTTHNKGQYDAWFENNVDGFDFDFLDTEFEDYYFTLEELGISLDPAEPIIQSESNEVRESKTAQNNVCEASESEVDITVISIDDMLDIDEFLDVMGEYECSQAQGLKTAQNVSEATAKEVEVTSIPDKNFFDIDELLGNINQNGQYDAWFENNVDGFDFDFLDTKFEDYYFTLEELGISLDPAELIM
nr:hypothetical protein [Tanacetum cinerariifolium]